MYFVFAWNVTFACQYFDSACSLLVQLASKILVIYFSYYEIPHLGIDEKKPHNVFTMIPSLYSSDKIFETFS